MSGALAPFDVAVVGGGPAGLSAALALAGAGVSVALVAPAMPGNDQRTTALLGGSVDFFRRRGLWARLAADASPLKRMRLVDASGRLLRAPDVTFDAGEVGRSEFGFNIGNGHLVAALTEAVAAHARISRFEAMFEGFAGDGVLRLSTGETFRAALVVAADGRKSRVREAAGIGVKSWSYPQEALVLGFRHARPHEDTSIEFHTTAGPFTLVPFGAGRSSLVWMDRREVITAMAGLDDAALAAEIERRSSSVFGAVTIDGPRQRWPISGFRAEQLAAGRVVLIGEAAHGMPPIGAQGFNLSLRDIDTLAGLVGPQTGRALDGVAIARRFARSRRVDVTGHVYGIDLFNRSLLSGFLPAHAARAAGLMLARQIKPLRHLLIRLGLGG